MLRTLSPFCQESWEVIDYFLRSDILFYLLTYASLAASRTLLKQLTTSLNFTLDSEDLFWWYKQKNWFLWTISAEQAAKNHRDKWELAWYLRLGIYTSIPTWHREISEISTLSELWGRTSMHKHGTTTTTVFLRADGKSLYLWLPSSDSLLSGNTLEPENTYSRRSGLKKPKGANHSYH